MYQGINKCQLSPKVDGENKLIHTFQPIEDCGPFLISDFLVIKYTCGRYSHCGNKKGKFAFECQNKVLNCKVLNIFHELTQRMRELYM